MNLQFLTAFIIIFLFTSCLNIPSAKINAEDVYMSNSQIFDSRTKTWEDIGPSFYFTDKYSYYMNKDEHYFMTDFSDRIFVFNSFNAVNLHDTIRTENMNFIDNFWEYTDYHKIIEDRECVRINIFKGHNWKNLSLSHAYIDTSIQMGSHSFGYFSSPLPGDIVTLSTDKAFELNASQNKKPPIPIPPNTNYVKKSAADKLISDSSKNQKNVEIKIEKNNTTLNPEHNYLNKIKKTSNSSSKMDKLYDDIQKDLGIKSNINRLVYEARYIDDLSRKDKLKRIETLDKSVTHESDKFFVKWHKNYTLGSIYFNTDFATLIHQDKIELILPSSDTIYTKLGPRYSKQTVDFNFRIDKTIKTGKYKSIRNIKCQEISLEGSINILNKSEKVKLLLYCSEKHPFVNLNFFDTELPGFIVEMYQVDNLDRQQLLLSMDIHKSVLPFKALECIQHFDLQL